MSHTITDEKGAPLPDSLQFESPIWTSVYAIVRGAGWSTEESVRRTDRAMRQIAELLDCRPEQG
jgi:hypothetical protein